MPKSQSMAESKVVANEASEILQIKFWERQIKFEF